MVCFWVVSGSSSDYGVQKALKETTVAMLEAHGFTTAQEKKDSKVGPVVAVVLLILTIIVTSVRRGVTPCLRMILYYFIYMYVSRRVRN